MNVDKAAHISVKPSCWNRDKRCRDQRKPACIGAKWILITVRFPAEFFAFLLVFKSEAVEFFTSPKRHGDFVKFVALCPSFEVVGLLD